MRENNLMKEIEKIFGPSIGYNMTTGAHIWKKIFSDLAINGHEINPRGKKTLELEDYQIIFPNPVLDVYCDFEARNLPYNYLAKEFSWYLGGDRNDTSIESASAFWKTVKNTEPPYYNSNYGHYFFKERQFYNAIDALYQDENSRQACIVINRPDVMWGNSKDKLCTNAVMFRIRKGKLNMSVQMRSNDIIYGLGIDAVMFSLIQQLAHQLLKVQYPDLQIGKYIHTAASLHIYEQHWHIMDSICNSFGNDEYRKKPIYKLADYNETIKVLDRDFTSEKGFSMMILSWFDGQYNG